MVAIPVSRANSWAMSRISANWAGGASKTAIPNSPTPRDAA